MIKIHKNFGIQAMINRYFYKLEIIGNYSYYQSENSLNTKVECFERFNIYTNLLNFSYKPIKYNLNK